MLYIRGDYTNTINNANEVIRLDNRNLGGYALAIVGLSQAQNRESLIDANISSGNAINLLSNDAFVNFARSCVRVKTGETEDARRFFDNATRANSQIQDPFLRIIIPRLQQTVIENCLSGLGDPPVPPQVPIGRYRIIEPSVNLDAGATAISSNGQFIAVGLRNGTVSVYRLQNRSLVGTFSAGQARAVISSVAISPNGQEVAIASASGEVKVFEISSRREKYRLDAGNSPLVVFSDNSNFLFTAGGSGTLRAVNNRTGQTVVSEPNTHGQGITSLTMSPDGRLLASGGGDGTIKLWSTSDLTPVDTYQAHQRQVQSLAFSADSNQIISAGLDDVIKSCDWRTKECIEIARSRDVISSIAVASNGHVVFSNSVFNNSGNNKIFIQDSKNGQPLGDLSAHRGQVNALAYTPDGRYLISGSDDRTLIIWEVQ